MLNKTIYVCKNCGSEIAEKYINWNNRCGFSLRHVACPHCYETFIEKKEK